MSGAALPVLSAALHDNIRSRALRFAGGERACDAVTSLKYDVNCFARQG
jgi:hypothetical protein